MKRLIVILALVALASSAFAMDLQNVTGFEWSMMTYDQRVWLLSGFGMAIFSLMDVVADTTLLDLDFEKREHYPIFGVIALFWQPDTVITIDDMIVGINAYYRRAGSLQIPLWRAYMEVMGDVQLAGL